MKTRMKTPSQNFADAQPERRTCILILGMHRSGTSALTRILNLAGAHLPDRVLGAGTGNERGHWEPEALATYHDRLLAKVDSAWHDWQGPDFSKLAPRERISIHKEMRAIIEQDFGSAPLFVLKEPRICRLAPFIINALEEAEVDIIPVLAMRNPIDVAASLMRRKGVWPENYTSFDAYMLWLRHVIDAERVTRNMRRCFVSYETLMTDWTKIFSTLKHQASLTFKKTPEMIAPLVEEFLSPQMRHHTSRLEDVALKPELRGLINATRMAYKLLENAPDNQEAIADLDTIYATLMQFLPMATHAVTAERESKSTLHHQFDVKYDNLKQEFEIKNENLRKEFEAERKSLEQEFEAERNDSLQQLKNLEGDLSSMRKQMDNLLIQSFHANAKKHELARIYKSIAWKWSAPFRILGKMKRKKQEKTDRKLLLLSGLFDARWYLEHNLDVYENKIDPVLHYLQHGGYEGRNPSDFFDSIYYLKINQDVLESGINPLLHYVKFGKTENRKISSKCQNHNLCDQKNRKNTNLIDKAKSLEERKKTSDASLPRRGIFNTKIKFLSLKNIKNLYNILCSQRNIYSTCKKAYFIFKSEGWNGIRRNISLIGFIMKGRNPINLLSIKNSTNYDIIKFSGFFDYNFYRGDDIYLNRLTDDVLIYQYIHYWRSIKNNPSQYFDNKNLHSKNKDIPRDINPLIYFLRYKNDPRPYQEIHSLKQTFKIIKKKDHNNRKKIIFDDISVIIPVYNGYYYVKNILSCLEQDLNRNYKIIFINDCSPDEKIIPLIENFCKNNINCDLINNEKNLGFVGTINKASSVCAGNFIILNTDTLFSGDWVKRLMRPIIEDDTVASTTPFSNSATIYSFPEFPEDNELLPGLTVDAVDAAFLELTETSEINLDAPTGVGFCMGINRNVWSKIGGFDEKAFAKGYGEENDWCQRAIQHGHRNVLVPDLFVYHTHGGSFLSREKEELITRNLKILHNRWPNYHSDVQNFIQNDPWRDYRHAAFLLICCQNSPVFFFDHALGGGTTFYREQRKEEILAENKPVLQLIYNHQAHEYQFSAQLGKTKKEWSEPDISWLPQIFDQLKDCKIIINSLVSWPRSGEILENIIKLCDQKQFYITTLFHDYFPICPSYTLLNDKKVYCHVPENLEICNQCLKLNGLIIDNDLKKSLKMNDWRTAWQVAFDASEEIVFFSEASKKIAERAFNFSKKKMFVRPHKPLIEFHPVAARKREGFLTIGVVGNINLAKGAEVVIQVAEKLLKTRPEARIFLIGNINPAYKVELPNFTIHGSYTQNELPILVEKYGINTAFLPSIWPETFSYVTTELMMLGMPIVAFNIGAPAERLKDYPNSTLINIMKKNDADLIINALYDTYQMKVFGNE